MTDISWVYHTKGIHVLSLLCYYIFPQSNEVAATTPLYIIEGTEPQRLSELFLNQSINDRSKTKIWSVSPKTVPQALCLIPALLMPLPSFAHLFLHFTPFYVSMCHHTISSFSGGRDGMQVVHSSFCLSIPSSLPPFLHY